MAKTTTTKKAASTKTATKKITSKNVLAMLKGKYDEVYNDGSVYCIKHNGKWGFADANGEIKIKPCFTGIGEEWIEDIIPTWGDGGIGFVNKKLKVIAKPQFSRASDFRKGVATVMQKSGKWGLIDKTGKIVIPFVFDNINFTSNGKIEAKIGSFIFVTK